jgi:AcrR family transcriptional regulator
VAYRRTERVIQRFNARRDAIVQAAQALAAESGMEAIQIAHVAARAGIAAGTVYRYFPSKSDLVAALITFVTERDLAAIRRAAGGAPGPLSAIAVVIIEWAARAVRRRRLTWAVLATTDGTAADALRLAARKSLAAEFERLIAAAVAGAHLPEQNCALAAAAMFGTVMEVLVGPLAPSYDSEAAARAAIQAVTLVVLRGVGIIDARARGLVVQAPWPRPDEA